MKKNDSCLYCGISQAVARLNKQSTEMASKAKVRDLVLAVLKTAAAESPTELKSKRTLWTYILAYSRLFPFSDFKKFVDRAMKKGKSVPCISKYNQGLCSALRGLLTNPEEDVYEMMLNRNFKTKKAFETFENDFIEKYGIRFVEPKRKRNPAEEEEVKSESKKMKVGCGKRESMNSIVSMLSVLDLSRETLNKKLDCDARSSETRKVNQGQKTEEM